MFRECLENVRQKNPLIHNITNYVTVNDCANILLACGGSPIMADDESEVEAITSICGGLNLNIGTLNTRTIEAMFLAGHKANALGHPILLDPVGAGASPLRTETAKRLVKDLSLTVIRGNISEIKTLATGSGTTKGVDADLADQITEENLDQMIAFAKSYAKETGAIIAITGAIDLIADAKNAYVIRNGVAMLSKITGSGCMLSAMTAAYITANQENLLEAVATSVCVMGLCGEQAFAKMKQNQVGSGSFRTYLVDAIDLLDGETLEAGKKYEMR